MARRTLVLVALLFALNSHASDPLPSWSETAPKKALLAFVTKVTTPGSPDFAPITERIAAFDNDGTLWCEQPIYPQFVFGMDRAKTQAAQHLEWKQEEPYKSALAGDLDGLAATKVKGLIGLTAGTCAGMTIDDFAQSVTDWLATARHPKTRRPYTEMVYQPMIELLAYLRANGFKTFIVSGGSAEFLRPWTEKIYGIPPEQVVGSTVMTKFELRDGKPVIVRLPDIEFLNDRENKPVGIDRLIGRRPILTFGNSDGDLPMLQWTAASNGARFMALVHHTDADREAAYDRTAKVGKLDKALDEAQTRGWTVVDMKVDWKTVYRRIE